MVVCSLANLSAQNGYLLPSIGFRTADILESNNTYSNFDIQGNNLYTNDGNIISHFSLDSTKLIKTYEKPAGYTAWPSFLTVSPDAKKIWTGYTVTGNNDDRIFCIDAETGVWDHKASFPANYDLVFYNEHVLVSGINSSDFGETNGIFLMDQTGSNAHRKIIQTESNAAGIATDTIGNIYFATYFFSEGNALYKWNDTLVKEVINNPERNDTYNWPSQGSYPTFQLVPMIAMWMKVEICFLP
jgi:hypothetical protein